MNIQNHIVKTIIVIQEAGIGLTRNQLQDILTGKESEDVQNNEFDQFDSFGIAEGSEDEDWNAIFDRAIEEGLLKVKNQKHHTLTYTPDGKKYRKKPRPVMLGESADDEDYSGIDDPELVSVMRGAMKEGVLSIDQKVRNPRTKRQIKLIQAIDRKIALDDFAQNENIDLDEVIDELEALRNNGKNLDITYFTDEVIGPDEVQEVRESLAELGGNLQKLRKEWGDVYNEQELRLLAYILS